MSLWVGLMALSLLLTASLFGERRQRGRERHRRAELAQALRDGLELLQLLQKHRGLGGQDSVQAQGQRREVARQLDRCWARWPGAAAGLPPLPQAWPALRERPRDFAGHSGAIEALIGAVALTERRLGVLGALPVYANADGDSIANACHRLEDLARLRGLAARAAAQPRCPLDLQVQLRYLCQRLRNGGEEEAGQRRVRQALEVIAQKLLDAERVAITPAACFELITPIIDDGVAALQRRMAM